jgi:RNA polymerase sigma factor (sigma-70 family)
MSREAFNSSVPDEMLNHYLGTVCKHDLLTHDEEKNLCRLAQSGCIESRNSMFLGNVRLVVSIAKRYKKSSTPLVDLIEEGNLGLFRAIEKFDPELGYRFSTYAAWWVRQSVQLAARKLPMTIDLPRDIYQLLGQMRKLKNSNDYISDTDLAEKLNLSLGKVKKLMLTPMIQESLDSPLFSDNHGETLVDAIPCDNDINSFDDTLANKKSSSIVNELLDYLKEKEAVVLKHRFGLRGESAKTLAEIGVIVNLTHERVRQIEVTALGKLKRHLSAQNIQCDCLLGGN